MLGCNIWIVFAAPLLGQNPRCGVVVGQGRRQCKDTHSAVHCKEVFYSPGYKGVVTPRSLISESRRPHSQLAMLHTCWSLRAAMVRPRCPAAGPVPSTGHGAQQQRAPGEGAAAPQGELRELPQVWGGGQVGWRVEHLRLSAHAAGPTGSERSARCRTAGGREKGIAGIRQAATTPTPRAPSGPRRG